MNNTLCNSCPAPFTATPELKLPRFRLGRAIRGWVLRTVDILFEWSERARTRRHLMELDDRLLKDIGLTRADAMLEASKPFWKV